MKRHYFIGIRLPKEIRERLHHIGSAPSLAFARYVHVEDYHLTLAFLGPCQEQQLASIKKALRALVTSWHSFPLRLSTFGTFGRKDRPRIFWIGVENEPLLYSYREAIVNEMEKLGFSLDKRPFTPHITIARKWIGETSFQRFETDLTVKSWLVKDIVLYESNVTKTPKYAIVESFPLHDRVL